MSAKSTTAKPAFQLTGWHVLAIFVGAFAVIIGANLTLAFNAVRSFPGLETKNSYIASQTFDARRAAQIALGWTVVSQATPQGVTLRITDDQGQAVILGGLEANLGRPTHRQDDRTPDFIFDGQVYSARTSLAPGYWDLWLNAQSLDGTSFEQRISLFVAG